MRGWRRPGVRRPPQQASGDAFQRTHEQEHRYEWDVRSDTEPFESPRAVGGRIAANLTDVDADMSWTLVSRGSSGVRTVSAFEGGPDVAHVCLLLGP